MAKQVVSSRYNLAVILSQHSFQERVLYVMGKAASLMKLSQ